MLSGSNSEIIEHRGEFTLFVVIIVVAVVSIIKSIPIFAQCL